MRNLLEMYIHYHKNENVAQAHNEVEEKNIDGETRVWILMWFESSSIYRTNAIAVGKLCLIDWKAYAKRSQSFFRCVSQTTLLSLTSLDPNSTSSNACVYVCVCLCFWLWSYAMWFIHFFHHFNLLFIVVSTKFSTQIQLFEKEQCKR